jgi:hypothetical protein
VRPRARATAGSPTATTTHGVHITPQPSDDRVILRRTKGIILASSRPAGAAGCSWSFHQSHGWLFSTIIVMVIIIITIIITFDLSVLTPRTPENVDRCDLTDSWLTSRQPDGLAACTTTNAHCSSKHCMHSFVCGTKPYDMQ